MEHINMKLTKQREQNSKRNISLLIDFNKYCTLNDHVKYKYSIIFINHLLLKFYSLQDNPIQHFISQRFQLVSFYRLLLKRGFFRCFPFDLSLSFASSLLSEFSDPSSDDSSSHFLELSM